MPRWLNLGLGGLVTTERLVMLAHAAVVLFLGWLLARSLSAAVARVMRSRTTPQSVMLIRRMVYYPILVLALMGALNELGFHLGVLLGAAGVLTVAIGFASQTSASNLISGLFLIAERPFVVGDVVQVEDVTGEVLSIDLLSVKLRTFDNLYVRVPNETIIKTRVTNTTHFPIRRFDMQVGVAYKEDLAKVRAILEDVADRNPLVLTEPAPLFIFQGFGESSLDMQFSVWAKRETWLEMRNQMHLQVKAAFDAAGVEIPFPHRTFYTGSQCEPLPVRMVGATEQAAVVATEPAPSASGGDAESGPA
ncbi:MAG: mechanosensitive ion channel family protein [Candidatus Krumholzibacteriia bacterium]